MKLSPTARKWVRGIVDFGGLAAFLVAFIYFRYSGVEKQEALMQATWALVAGSAVALAVGLIVERRIAPFPLIGGLAGLLFGGAALFFHDPRLLKIKPTVMNTIYGVLLLAGLAFRKNPLRMLMGEAIQMPEEGWRRLTLHYAIFFLALAGLNEFVWRTQSDDFWVGFRFPGMLLLTMLFSFSQVPLMMKYAKTDEPPPPHVE
jgi:intracellular septation protein